MKKIEIETGQQYKVEHKETKQTQILNAQQLARFVFKNDYQNYNIIELKDKKFIDYVPTWLIMFLMSAAFAASILLHIHLNY
tara:strand:- start:243 stop:488 length:246 start_codon:yes stop_codon:yes gene_type:complete